MEPQATKDYLLIPNEVMITKANIMIPAIIIALVIAIELSLFIFTGSLINLICLVIIVPIFLVTIRAILKAYSPTSGFVPNEQ